MDRRNARSAKSALSEIEIHSTFNSASQNHYKKNRIYLISSLTL
ncbi:hypothetical protein T4B_13745 [Trichinella pseudospiralis]|uniref:Uncharacterized protein n=1 Tax=Trichinella pseudospiralis TaxID=6337 RepID=A0A0V1GNF4_TRIPS|nr:hypothetical protein T4B_13745 [Trichinella pseudospiralis]